MTRQLTRLRKRIGAVACAATLAVATLSTAPALSAIADAGEGMSDGVERIIAELRAREAELEKKERDLVAREESIGELEAEVEKRIGELDAMRTAIETRIEDWSSSDGNRIVRLAKVYSSMPAARAAGLLQDLDRDLATSILAGMKEKNSAAVLAVMSRAQALKLSSRFARPLASEVGKRGKK